MNLDTPLSEIPPIRRGAFDQFTRAEMDQFVELPLLKAAQMLYDLGIRTTSADANHENAKGFATITIDLESLCAANDERLRKLQKARPTQLYISRKRDFEDVTDLSFVIPIQDCRTARDVSDRMVALIEEAHLLRQPAYWADPLPYDQWLTELTPSTRKKLVANALAAHPGEERKQQEYVIDHSGNYSADGQTVFLSKEAAEHWNTTFPHAEPGTSTQVNRSAIQL